ncbi:MAG: hypothetical protein M1836_001327 [Candelina mexicana]|nr:MAG: hypothetical protein M1836_001327 [Candelina mexicana]
MDYYLLPPTVYQPPRLGQAPNLNTIIEDENSDVEPVAKHRSPKVRRMGNTSPYAFSPLESRLTPTRRYDHRETHDRLSPASAVSSSSSTWSAPKHGPDFDELYDVSDDDQDQAKTKISSPFLHHSSKLSQQNQRNSTDLKGSPNRYPTLVIPSPRLWPNVKNHKDSPVPPTPPPKIPISPAVLSLLARHAPTTSAPPSLDGSMTSEQLANSTAPSTPNTQTNSDDPADWSSGVHLHPDALATLRALSNSPAPDEVFEVPLPPAQEMQQLPTGHSRSNSTEVLSPATQQSFASLAQLDIPSPGVFFSSLGAGARHTWAQSSAPPSTTTAEKFYDCPWKYPPDRPIERVVEIDEDMTDGPPTARQEVTRPPTEGDNLTPRQEITSPPSNVEEVQEIDSTEVAVDYDENYERELEQLASSNLDRTSVWLASQNAYMSSLRNTSAANIDEDGPPDKARPLIKHSPNPSISSTVKKSVRFLENPPATPTSKNQTELEKKDSTYYRAFQHLVRNSTHNDTFVHRLTRLEALQTHRTCLLEAHRNQLLGRYQLNLKARPSPPRPISLMPSGGNTMFDEAPDPTAEQKLIARVEREREALEQISASMWNIAATRFLKNGHLLASPGGRRLAQALPPLPAHACVGADRNRARLLDLGGQATCDWGWHAAREYPNVKVYTVITKQQINDTCMRGPHNHRRVSVPQLWRLPFRDGYFDVVSARSLYSFLKTSHVPLPVIPKDGGDGDSKATTTDVEQDEYATCLAECLRVLKPGGYLEFEIFDADLVHAGPLGLAMSVEFAFNLKTRGYDPYATRNWIGRLSRAGFMGVKRAWLFLPLSGNAAATSSSSSSGQVQKQVDEVQRGLGIRKSIGSGGHGEVVGGVVDDEKNEIMGSTHDAASIAGVVGSWAWERWMLKLQIEMGKSEDRALESVGAVLEEGRRTGAGWRCLTGWARKPVQGRAVGRG